MNTSLVTEETLLLSSRVGKFCVVCVEDKMVLYLF